MLHYGFTAHDQRCVFHSHGDRRVADWARVFSDPRYRPARTQLVGIVGDALAGDLAAVLRRVDYIAANRPKCFAVTAFDDLSLDVVQSACHFLRGAAVDAQAFGQLDDMFRWIEIRHEAPAAGFDFSYFEKIMTLYPYGRVAPDVQMDVIDRALTDPRWRPGETICFLHLGGYHTPVLDEDEVLATLEKYHSIGWHKVVIYYNSPALAGRVTLIVDWLRAHAIAAAASTDFNQAVNLLR